MKKSEEGSIAFVALAAAAALFSATMYVQNASTQISQTTKKAKVDEKVDAARMNNLSNLSRVRSLLSASKVGDDLFEPAVYPSNYFAERWEMKVNTLRPSESYSVSGNNFTLKSFAASVVPMSQASAYFRNESPRSQLADLTASKELTILRLNPHPTHKYWIQSVDVKAKNLVGGAAGSALDSIGRIQLAAPEPGPVSLWIAPAGSTTFTKNYGLPTAPLLPGKYKLQLRASGVVLYGEISRSTGGSMLLGMDERLGVTHKANNIHAVDEILGETIDIELGQATTATETVTVEAPEESPLSAHTTHNSNCSFTITPTGGGTVTPTGGTPVTVGGTTTTESAVPSEIEIEVKIYRVDGEQSERSFKQKFYVTNTVTTTLVTQTTGGTTAPTSGGDRCANRCPRDRDTIFPDYVPFLTLSFHGSADKTKVDVRRSAETNGLPNPGGQICANFELVAQDLVSSMGGVLPDQINTRPDYQRLWDIFNERVTTDGLSMPLERFYAYIAPSCGRELLGTRNGCGCFASDTKIRMGDGSERLAKEIRQGDVLWNPKTKRPQLVRKVVVGPENPLLYVLTIGGKQLEVTTEHPFLTAGGLRPAERLNVGDIIIDNEQQNRVEAIEREDRALDGPVPDVWNFELEGSDSDDDHYVLANGVMTGDLYLQIKLKQSSNAK
jgi:hypothetical protein